MTISVDTPVITTHLIKSEDLNHHGSLFAGRTAEWFVESGFLAASQISHPKNIVCVNLHGMNFKKPARLGDIIRFSSYPVYTGTTSIMTFVAVSNSNGDSLVQGYITFVHVDENGLPTPHGIKIVPADSLILALQKDAIKLKEFIA